MEPTCPKEWVQLCPQLAFGCCPLCKDEPTTLSTAQLVTVVVHQVGAGGHGHLPRLLGRCHGTKHLPPSARAQEPNPATTRDFCCIWCLFWCTIKAAGSWKSGANGSVVPASGRGLVQELRGPLITGCAAAVPPQQSCASAPLGCRRQQAEEAEP